MTCNRDQDDDDDDDEDDVVVGVVDVPILCNMAFIALLLLLLLDGLLGRADKTKAWDGVRHVMAKIPTRQTNQQDVEEEEDDDDN